MMYRIVFFVSLVVLPSCYQKSDQRHQQHDTATSSASPVEDLSETDGPSDFASIQRSTRLNDQWDTESLEDTKPLEDTESLRDTLYDNCYEGPEIIRTVEQITVLKGYSCVLGNLTITGDDLTHVDALSNIQRIEGHLSVWNTTSLRNLDGFSKLVQVGLNVQIQGNKALATTGGLSNLKTVRGVKIKSNDALLDLDGLVSLTQVGSLEIAKNSRMNVIDGLSNLTNVEADFVFADNPSVTSLAPLSNLKSVGGSLLLHKLFSLRNLSGLSGLVSVAERFSVANMPSIRNLKGPSQLRTVGSLFVIGNNKLTTLDGLPSLTSIPDLLTVVGNPSLIEIDGLTNIPSVGILRIVDNDALRRLSGLSGLSVIHHYIEVTSNRALLNCQPCSLLFGLSIRPLNISIFNNKMDRCGDNCK